MASRSRSSFLSAVPYFLGVTLCSLRATAQAQEPTPPPSPIAPPAETAPPPEPPAEAPPPQAPPQEAAPPPAAPAPEQAAAPAPEQASPSASEPTSPPEEAEERELGSVIVTGVRGGQTKTVADSPSPVDVIGPKEITETGRTGLKEILGAIVPAITMPAQGGGGTSASVRPYSYRGLSGDYLLVLVNGKRRHTTSLINNLSRVSGGSTPVDLDLIPAPAVGRIEILREGAAAQYGSDAIGGVLNIILDDSPEGLSFSQTAGQTFKQKGELFQQQLSIGIPLGEAGGFIRFSAEGKYHGPSTSSGSPIPETRTVTVNGQPVTVPNYYYPPIYDAASDTIVPDPREANTRGKVHGLGYGRSNRDLMLVLAYNAELPLSESVKLYSFSTLSYRDIKDARGNFTANNVSSLPEIYPQGFQAYRRIWEWDGQATVGAKGDAGAWSWDLSTSYGRDYVKLGAVNTLNPSLGPTSKTEFYMGKQIQDLWVSNLDASRAFDVGLANPLQLSLGLEYRWERFENRPGEPDSYRDGGYAIPVGDDPFHQPPLLQDGVALGGFGGLRPNPGLVSFSGTNAIDARKLSRNTVAGYAEVSTNLLRPWYLGIAGRAEHYDDSAGNVLSGKIVTRYEFLPGFAVRGGANTGFRAPSLAQTGFSTTQYSGARVGNEVIFTTSQFMPVDSPVAKALGAEPLKPEKSVSLTAGVTAEPARSFRVTLDAFQTKITDRIVKTDFIGIPSNGGAAIQRILDEAGVRGVNSGQFFFNAVDTTTRGLDIVAEYTLRDEKFGAFRPTLAYSLAVTKIDSVADNPPELQNVVDADGNPVNVVVFGRAPQRDLEYASPRSKLILGANWSFWRLHNDIRFTRYGEYQESSATPGFDRTFSAKWITDVDIAFDLSDHVSAAVGSYNLFNVYPDRNGIVDPQLGWGQYGSFAPFGLIGGFYYARVNVTY